MDRFILNGSELKLRRKIRYQRSRHRSEPESCKNTLSAVDMDKKPFYEPTRELVCVRHLEGGNFSVLLLSGKYSEKQRWQIFFHDSVTQRVNSISIKHEDSMLFDISDSDVFIDEQVSRYERDKAALVSDIQAGIVAGKVDDVIARELLARPAYGDRLINQDTFSELVYAIRTGVVKDDFIPASQSGWPLSDTPDQLESGAEFPVSQQMADLQLRNGLSSTFYYQQVPMDDGKPMKNKACVMLAMGLTRTSEEKFAYIGILNFSVSSDGRLSRLSDDKVHLPDINMQLLDDNPYHNLAAIQHHQSVS